MVQTSGAEKCLQGRLEHHDLGTQVHHADLYSERLPKNDFISYANAFCVKTATALGKLGHPDGELNLTRAAAKSGVIQMVSPFSHCQ